VAHDTPPEQALVPAPVRRMLRTAERLQQRAHRRSRLADAIVQRRTPKLLASATRLARPPSEARSGRSVAVSQKAMGVETFEHVRMVTAPQPRASAETSAGAPVELEFGAGAEPSPVDDPQAAHRAKLKELYGLSDAGYEWMFGDPERALADPSIVVGAVVAPPPSPPKAGAQPSAPGSPTAPAADSRPVSRRPAGRGARILEGPAQPAAPREHGTADAGDRHPKRLSSRRVPERPSAEPPAPAPESASISTPEPRAAAAERAADVDGTAEAAPVPEPAPGPAPAPAPVEPEAPAATSEPPAQFSPVTRVVPVGPSRTAPRPTPNESTSTSLDAIGSRAEGRAPAPMTPGERPAMQRTTAVPAPSMPSRPRVERAPAPPTPRRAPAAVSETARPSEDAPRRGRLAEALRRPFGRRRQETPQAQRRQSAESTRPDLPAPARTLPSPVDPPPLELIHSGPTSRWPQALPEPEPEPEPEREREREAEPEPEPVGEKARSSGVLARRPDAVPATEVPAAPELPSTETPASTSAPMATAMPSVAEAPAPPTAAPESMPAPAPSAERPLLRFATTRRPSPTAPPPRRPPLSPAPAPSPPLSTTTARPAAPVTLSRRAPDPSFPTTAATTPAPAPVARAGLMRRMSDAIRPRRAESASPVTTEASPVSTTRTHITPSPSPRPRMTAPSPRELARHTGPISSSAPPASPSAPLPPRVETAIAEMAPARTPTPRPGSAPRVLSRSPATTVTKAVAAPPRTNVPTRTLARAATSDHASASPVSGATPHPGASGGSGGSSGGGNSDQVYADVMRRVREEQEQLGQLINHPF
jgi:hypothetical protein